MNAQQILTEARALIADEAHWTSYVYARDNGGRIADAADPTARQWCMRGAFQRAVSDSAAHLTESTVGTASCALHDAAEALTGERHLARINDWQGHAVVIEVYDRAIELAGQMETPR